jgi:hypothetical protein
LLDGNPGIDPFLVTPVPDGVPLAMHIHPHLSIVIDGQAQVIPAGIGLGPDGDLPIHTHDATGTIHVESPVLRVFHLQDFFSVWGQSFTSQEILGHRVDASHSLTMSVNGQVSTAFGAQVLNDQDSIVIQYGGPLVTSATAAVWTNQADYAPGTTAQIGGGGFAAREKVDLQVVHTDGRPNTDASHTPWTVAADATGAINTSWLVDNVDAAGSTLQVKAVGETSHQTAQATFTDSAPIPHPFWIFGHNPNSIADARASVAVGANALEPDVMWISGQGLVIRHDSLPSSSSHPLIPYLQALSTLAGTYNLTLVAFDVKSAAAQHPGAALELANDIQTYILNDRPHVRIILSVASSDDAKAFFPALKGTSYVTNPTFGFQIDSEEDPRGEVALLYNLLGSTDAQTGFGDGTAGCCGRAFPIVGPFLGPNVPPALQQAVWTRTAFGTLNMVSYGFAITGTASMMMLIDSGVDGLIPSDFLLELGKPFPLDTLDALALVNAHYGGTYLATTADNPFSVAGTNASRQGYGLEVHTTHDTDDIFGGPFLTDSGTDSLITFTLRGERGDASTVVDSSWSKEMEDGDTNCVFIPSGDLGRLKSITVSHDNSGPSPDWELDWIKIRSAAYIGAGDYPTVGDPTKSTVEYFANFGGQTITSGASHAVTIGLQSGIPFLATVTNGDLVLNMGPNAAARVNGNITDGNESFTVHHVSVQADGSEMVTVSAFGSHPQTYIGVRQIHGYGGGGNETLTVDGAFTIPIFFNGGGGPGNTLVLQNATFNTITHTFTNQHDGTVALDPDGPGGTPATLITYTGLAPITDHMSAGNRLFAYTGGSETITLSADPGAVAGVSRIVSTLGESVDFTNPTSTLTINASAGTGPDTINLQGLDAAFHAKATVNASNSGDHINLATAPGTPSWTINGGRGHEVLAILNHIGSPIPPSFILTNNTVVLVQFALVVLPGGIPIFVPSTTAITYSGIKDLSVTGADGGNTFFVNSLDPTMRVALKGGKGNDSFIVGDSNDGLNQVSNPTSPPRHPPLFYFPPPNHLTISGGGGTDALFVDDRGTSDDHHFDSFNSPVFTVTDRSIHRINHFRSLFPRPIDYDYAVAIDYDGIATIDLFGSSGSAGAIITKASPTIFNVSSTPAATKLSLYGGSAADTFLIGDPNNSLDDVKGPVMVNGLGGSTSLVIDDRFSPFRQGIDVFRSFAVTDQFVQRTHWAINTVFPGVTAFDSTIGYANVASLQILGNGNTTHYQVLSTPVGIPVAIQAGAGDDTFTVGDSSHSLARIQGPVTLDGGGGSDSLVFDDTAPRTVERSRSFTVTQNQVIWNLHVRFFPVEAFTVAISYSNINSLKILGNDHDTLYQVLSTAAGTPVTLKAGAGNNQVEVGSAAAGLDNIRQPVTINEGAGAVQLTLEDLATSSFLNTYTLTDHSVTRSAVLGTLPIVNFDHVGKLALDGATNASNFINVQNTPLSSTVALTGGHRSDFFTIGDANHDFSWDTGSRITVTGLGGIDHLILDDRGLTSTAVLEQSRSFIVSDQNVQWVQTGMSPFSGQYFTRFANLGYSNIQSLLIFGNTRNTAYQVLSTAAGTPLAIHGGASGDTFAVGDATHALDGLQAGLTFDDKGGQVQMTLNDAAATGPHTYSLYINRFDRTGAASVQFSNVKAITLDVGAGSDPVTNTLTVVDVWSTVAGTSLVVNCGPGMEEVGFVAEQNAIQGLVTIHGQPGASDHIFYDDTANPNPQAYTFTANMVSRSNLAGVPDLAALTFDGVVQVILFEPSVGGNQTNVQSVAAGTLCNVLDYNGDHMVVGSLAPNLGGNLKGILGPVEVHSRDPNADPNDQVSLVIDDSGNTDTTPQTITFSKNVATNPYIYMDGLEPATTSIVWWLTPASSVTLLGGAANKTFVMQPFVSATPLTIKAGGGSNTLDYSAYSTGVYVNLQTGTATDLAGIANIQNVTGGAGNNILVGNGGNVLTGGNGFNLLIAGGTASTLVGGSGSDLLIGGTTIHDKTKASLDAILAEWSSGASYDDRIDHLRATLPGGLNGTTLLNAGTVLDNHAADVLTGGLGLDWFWAFAGDTVTDLNNGGTERVNG